MSPSAPQLQAVQQDQREPARELATALAEVRGAKWALEPPKNAVQARSAARVPPVKRDVVTENWMQQHIAILERFAKDPKLTPEQRANASTGAALGEGMIAQHFTTFPWNKLTPGRNAIHDLQTALATDPNHRDAAIAYTMTLMGIRNSGHRDKAEEYLRVQTTPELTRVVGSLAAHPESLLAQTLIGIAAESLAADGAVPASVASANAAAKQRLAALRQDKTEVEDTEEALHDLRGRKE